MLEVMTVPKRLWDRLLGAPGGAVFESGRLRQGGCRPPGGAAMCLCCLRSPFQEHRRCGRLDPGVGGERVWATCTCGDQIMRRAGGGPEEPPSRPQRWRATIAQLNSADTSC